VAPRRREPDPDATAVDILRDANLVVADVMRFRSAMLEAPALRPILDIPLEQSGHESGSRAAAYC
jgi:hypothetical protein